MIQFKSRQVADGDAVLERLAGMSVPTELKSSVASAKQVHKGMRDKQKEVTRTLVARDKAVATATATDTTLDGLLIRLAAKLVGAELGTRANPFAAFSKYTPSQLSNLAYATEAKEARALATAVKKSKPPAEVVRLADAVTQAANSVDAAIKAIAAPQRAYSSALGQRDALLVEWTAAFDRLERRATGAWADDTATFEAVFARASAMAAPAKKKPKAAKPAKDATAADAKPV